VFPQIEKRPQETQNPVGVTPVRARFPPPPIPSHFSHQAVDAVRVRPQPLTGDSSVQVPGLGTPSVVSGPCPIPTGGDLGLTGGSPAYGRL